MAAPELIVVGGANGAGKTTLFRMITGEEQPDSGSIRLGDTVQLASVDQSRDSLDPDRTVYEDAEIFARNLGSESPLQLERGLNDLWMNGGLLYAMPFR